MIGTTQKTNYPDIGVCIYAGAQRLSHQYRRILVLLPFCTDLKLLWLPVIELTDIMA